MPKFISDEGVWVPGKEKVALERINEETGEKEPFIYEGDDRAALKMLEELDASEDGYIGTHFTENMDLFELARAKGYDSIEDYVKKLGYNSDKAKEIVAKHKAKINTHTPPPKKEGKKFIGGGTNQSGQGGDKIGGFGDYKDSE